MNKVNDALQDVRNEIIARHLRNKEHDDYSNGYSVALEELLSFVDTKIAEMNYEAIAEMREGRFF